MSHELTPVASTPSPPSSGSVTCGRTQVLDWPVLQSGCVLARLQTAIGGRGDGVAEAPGLRDFPGWLQPVLRALPLTALIDGLRAASIDGAGVTALALPALILRVWRAGGFALALRHFRWT